MMMIITTLGTCSKLLVEKHIRKGLNKMIWNWKYGIINHTALLSADLHPERNIQNDGLVVLCKKIGYWNASNLGTSCKIMYDVFCCAYKFGSTVRRPLYIDMCDFIPRRHIVKSSQLNYFVGSRPDYGSIYELKYNQPEIEEEESTEEYWWSEIDYGEGINLLLM